LITEQAPNYAPVANPFVLRNRIQAALSDYIVPVEMGKDSRTRHSVHYAVKYRKTVILCMPNSFEIDHYLPQYEGIVVCAMKYRTKRNSKVIIIRKLEVIWNK
jgi:DNA processing protein